MKTITPTNNNGSIQIRFRLAGRRYGFNPIPGSQWVNSRDRKTAQAIATRIENDILAGNFDETLDSYRLAPKTEEPEPGPEKPKNLLALWDLWVTSLDLPPHTAAMHYARIRIAIVKTNPGLEETGWLARMPWKPSTHNHRLTYLRSCYGWAVSQGYVRTNPYVSVKPRKAAPEEIKPFSREELRAILSGFEGNPYKPFVLFLMLTGCRLSEAIGLTWEHVDFQAGTVTIKESLSKDPLGNGYKRIRKQTKTGTVRVLSLTPELKALLEGQLRVNPSGLIFKSPRGCTISSEAFRERAWRPTLAAVGVPYRRPHVLRHSLASHAIAQGIPLTGVAYLLGHRNTNMVIKTYGHLIDRPDLPNLGV